MNVELYIFYAIFEFLELWVAGALNFPRQVLLRPPAKARRIHLRYRPVGRTIAPFPRAGGLLVQPELLLSSQSH